MKKILSLFLILIFVLFAVSCGKTKQNTPPDNIPDYVFTDYSIEDVKPDNDFIDAYYTESDNSPDISSILSSYTESGLATDSFSSLYKSSQTIKYIPIYGTYLEPTNLIACCFMSENGLLGTHAVIVEDKNGELSIKELFTVVNSNIYNKSSISDSSCLEVLNECREKYPSFDIKGLVYTTNGYPCIYPVGVAGTEKYMSYFFGDLCEFNLVDKFSTIDEGYIKFTKYFENRAATMSSMPIYAWESAYWSDQGYANYYRHNYATSSEKNYYLSDYDSVIAVPLLDSNKNEGVYALHLFYSKGDLIAEVLLEIKDDELTHCKEFIATKDAVTGEYQPLTEINYKSEINKLLYLDNIDDTSTVKGVGFDGKNYFLIFS